MKSIQFSNGDQMPLLGLGTWKSEPGDVIVAVKEAIRLGYRHIDCALIYGNETEIGQALFESFQEGLVSRDQMWITSKLWNDSHAAADVQAAVEKSLADLQLGYLDLYLIHWPVALKKGVLFPETAADMISLDALPLAETWAAMEGLVDKGLCRHIGVSNFSTAKLSALVKVARLKPEMIQNEMHPYLQQPDLLALCKSHDIHLTAYSPLGSLDRPEGLKVAGEPILLGDATITTIAERHGITAAQVLLSWGLQRGVAVIPKSVNSGRMKENLAAVEVTLTQEDMQAIASIDQHRRYVDGAFWALDGGAYTQANIWDEG